jgi:hypothetical protein
LWATKKDFEKQNRRRFVSRIATGDYDAIIIGHQALKRFLYPGNAREKLKGQISEITYAIRKQSSNGERTGISSRWKSSRKTLRLN